MKGGESGEAISLKKPESSLLLRVLASGFDPHMPPKKQMESRDIRVLGAWIRNGARWAEGAMSGELVPLRPVLLTPLPSVYHPVLALALSDEGSKLVAGRGSRVILYQVTSTNVVVRDGAQAHEDAVQSAAFSPDGKQVATGAFRKLVFWSVGEALTKRMEVTTGFSDRLTALTFTSDGTRLLAAEGATGLRGRIRVLDVASGALQRTWDAHGDVIFDLSLSQDDRLLATASADRLVKLWDFSKGKETGKLEGHAAAVYGVSLNPEGTQLVSAGADKQLRIWDVTTREKLIGLGDPKAGVVAARWLRTTNRIFAAVENGQILSYSDFKPHSGEQSSSSGTERSAGQASEGVQCLAVSRDGGVVCVGGQDGCIQVWAPDGRLIAKLLEPRVD